MQVAVGNMVTIILGITTFIGGTVMLGNIMDTAGGQVEQLTQQERDDYLNSFPPRQTFYVPHARGTIEDNIMRIPFGIYNAAEEERTFTLNVSEESEITDFNPELIYQENYTIGPGEREIFTSIIESQTWPQEQATFILTLSRDTGEEISKKAVFT